MFGSVIGNVIAAIYFLVFQVCGIAITLVYLKRERKSFRILLGSVLGSVLLQWLPAIYSFVFGFTQIAHIIAIGTVIVFTIVIILYNKYGLPLRRGTQGKTVCNDWKQETVTESVWKRNIIWILIIAVFGYFVVLLNSHTIYLKDGAMYAGQCTYGDMNLHLGIITSIANQGYWPPEYSILPGTKLAYPFLCDSISSSMYIFGSSLRFAYIFPMLFAIIQVMYGLYTFLYAWLKKAMTATFAWILFIFNGGFGIIYFLDGVMEDSTVFTRIFTEFYNTPTNFVEQNVRWSNVIVDMLLPQRATLFGWAILFPTLTLLYKAVHEKKPYFFLSGILIGALPLIHTHSFLFMGIVCASWCLFGLIKKNYGKGEVLFFRKLQYYMPYLIVGILLCMEWMSYQSNWKEEQIFLIPFAVIGPCIFAGLYYFIKTIQKNSWNDFVRTWGILVIVAVGLALPQLFGWTFQQANNDSFLGGNFNWANEKDPYLWFYIKNLGVFSLLILPALFHAKKKDLVIVFPALLTWFVAEFIKFQPNTYDNNKLLYPAYAMLCGLVAMFFVEIVKLIKRKSVQVILISLVIFLSSISAILTMGREYVSEYMLYDENQVEMSLYIDNYTPKDAVILTNTRHNNAISSLTGRNIVCGTGTFLYYHGVAYMDREKDVESIYENIIGNLDLINEYNIDYILVGPEERNSYMVDESTIEERYTLVYTVGDVKLYAVSNRAVQEFKTLKVRNEGNNE